MRMTWHPSYKHSPLKGLRLIDFLCSQQSKQFSYCGLKLSYRITEWLRLAGSTVRCLVQPPAQSGTPIAGSPGPCPDEF